MYGKECKDELLLFLIIVIEINASNCNWLIYFINRITSKQEKIPIMSSCQPSASVFFAMRFKQETIGSLLNHRENCDP